MKYATIASTFSGNKGAASMLEASIQTISKKDKDAEFYVFTIYPKEDEKFNSYKNVRLLSAKPLFLGLVINPLSLIYKILPPLRPLLRKQRHIKALCDADVLLDQGGITFVDGRAKFLIYNVATILPAIMAGTPVIKCSQAMGPFNSYINRTMAKAILPKVKYIFARGSKTFNYLEGLGLKNVTKSTDLAFLMKISPEEAKRAKSLVAKHRLAPTSQQKVIAIMPSEVVRKKAESQDEDYIAYNVSLINKLAEDGYKVILMAYSARETTNSRHNNDLPLCREIASQAGQKELIFIDEELSAQILRKIISHVDMVITSRFHAMVAALSVKTPPLVIGWSHKYQEIMEMFDLSDNALDSKRLSNKLLINIFRNSISKSRTSSKVINKKLSTVKKDAEIQINKIISAAKSR